MGITSIALIVLAICYGNVQVIMGCPDDNTTPQPTPTTQTGGIETTSSPDVTYIMQAIPTPLSQYTSNTTVNSPPECECIVLKDCKEWKEYGANNSGIYTVNPDNGQPFRVYCDMITDDGGWTVFQRRKDGSVDFYRGWNDYKEGFGDLTGEYWLGLEKIHRLTGEDKQLRIDLGDFSNNYRYAKYSTFKLGNEATKYTLSVGGYTGNAGDSLMYHNKRKFTTKDSDNDGYGTNCAIQFKGAWWYHSCYYSNINGLYSGGVEWHLWKGYYYPLRFTEMKFK